MESLFQMMYKSQFKKIDVLVLWSHILKYIIKYIYTFPVMAKPNLESFYYWCSRHIYYYFLLIFILINFDLLGKINKNPYN